MKNVKNVIFDIANVLLQFSRDRLVKRFYKGKYPEYIKRKVFFRWEDMDAGILTYKEHLKLVKSTLPKRYHNTAEKILTRWEETMFYTKGIKKLILDCEKKYDLYVLSNMTDHFILNESKFDIFKHFKGIIYSAPIKMLKPNEDIFKYALDKYNLKASETLVVDDLKENLAGAARLSIKTFLFDNNAEELRKLLLT